MTGDWSDEETNDPLVADTRNFYKVEKWTRDDTKVDSCFVPPRQSAGRFYEGEKQRPPIRLTIRQRTRVLDQWPQK
jgi:hypothetical protein